METTAHDIEQLLGAMQPITLDEMKSIRLMNRTDQKYVTDTATLLRLLALAGSDYRAQVVEGKRVCGYATTYYDFPDEAHSLFRQHATGRRPRTKVRVRTYVESALTFLEVKQKDNHGKTRKQRIRLSSPEAASGAEGEAFVREAAGIDFHKLHPAVSNSFSRITLVNRAKTERLTIDFGLRFHSHITGDDTAMPGIVVVELKRDGRVPSPILPILRRLRVKPSGFSKYCIGATVTGSERRTNRFKKRLVKIRKVAEAHQPPAAVTSATSPTV